MQTSRPVPDLAIVVALTPGGPYAPGDVCSLAFIEATVGRLIPHDACDAPSYQPHAELVPESITARVARAAGPYRIGTLLTLSFVDPTIARIHEQTSDRYDRSRADDLPARSVGRSGNETTSTYPAERHIGTIEPPAIDRWDEDDTNDVRTGAGASNVATTAQTDDRAASARAAVRPILQVSQDDPMTGHDGSRTQRPETIAATDIGRANDVACETPPPKGTQLAPSAADRARVPCVEVHLQWNPERVRKFVTVVDKLFTVERLGWYRHVLTMRLLVPDRITCGDPPADVEVMRHLHALRGACAETFGRPMLAAFMPNFVVTPDWLESIDSPALARALAGVRSTIAPFVADGFGVEFEFASDSWTLGRVDPDDFDRSPMASVEALMPVLVPSVAINDELTRRLSAYRRTLIDVFGQTANASEAVRLGAMTHPNHSLDDQLWRLVGSIGECFAGAAIA